MTAPDPRLGEIEARLAAASKGPWKVGPVEQGKFAGIEAHVYSLRGSHILLGPIDGEAGQAKTDDAEFIAHAPADVSYLLAELRTAREALARVEAVAAEWEDLAGSGSDWERVYGKQKVSVEFAVSRIRAAIADPADPSTDPDGVALVEAIIERKAQDHD